VGEYGSAKLSFFNLSPLILKTPGKGHGYEFHSSLTNEAARRFLVSMSLGPVSENSKKIKGALNRKHFEKRLGALFLSIDLRDDLSRIRKILNKQPGPKLLHIYEGGFRELVILLRILFERDDTVGVFNFFFLDPWSAFFRSKGLLARFVRKRLAVNLTQLSSKLFLTSDSEESSKLVSQGFGMKEISVYPLFSSIGKPSEVMAWEDRPIQYLFSPRTKAEQVLVKRTIELMAREITGPKSIIILSRWSSSFKLMFHPVVNESGFEIEIVNRPLDKQEYSDIFQKSQIVILPYLDGHYSLGSSGKLLDSRISMAHSIVQEKSTLASVVAKNNWGQVFDGTSEGLIEAITSLEGKGQTRFFDPDPTVESTLTGILRHVKLLKPVGIVGKPTRAVLWIPFSLGWRGSLWLATNAALAFLVFFRKVLQKIAEFLKKQVGTVWPEPVVWKRKK
jgi:hypothetical protein